MSTNIKTIFKDGLKMYRLVIVTERKKVLVTDHWSIAGASSHLLSYMAQQQPKLVVAA